MKDIDNKDFEQCKNYRGKQWSHHQGNASGGAVYGLGIIGAAIFFIGHATTFWAGALGLLQAMVWPAFLVYEALKVLIK